MADSSLDQIPDSSLDQIPDSSLDQTIDPLLDQMVNPPEQITYTIQCMDKSLHQITLLDTATVGDLRVEASKIKTSEPTLCKLIYNGKIFTTDDQVLTTCGVPNGQRIVLLVQQKAKPVVETKQENVIVDHRVMQPAQVQPAQVAPGPVPQGPQGPQDDVPELVQNLPPNVMPVLNIPPEGDEDDEDDMVGGMGDINYEALAQQIQQNPQDFLNLMMQHPIVGGMVQENQDDFLELFQNPDFINQIVNPNAQMGDVPEGDGNLLGQAQVQLSVEDQADIREIMEFTGASFNVILQYYIALDRNKEATTNMILGDM